MPPSSSPSTAPIPVRLISDIACPFCYIGFRQLLEASKTQKIPLKVQYHSYMLNPSMPEEGFPRAKYFREKFGMENMDASPMSARLKAMGEEVGIHFVLSKPDVVSNTQRAQALMEKAKRDLGTDQQLQLLKLFFQSYFENGMDIGDAAVYTKLAKEVGLSISENHFETDEGKNDLKAVKLQDQEAKTRYNVSGVPTFVFQDKYAVSGAQGADSLGAVLNRVQNKL